MKARKVNLVKPKEASGEVAKIFEDIKKTKGDRFLTPTWGFFAQDAELLKHWWGLTKRLQITPGRVPKQLMISISLVAAQDAKCARCINNHQTHLIEHFNLNQEYVDSLLDFENAKDVPPGHKAVLKFVKKLITNEETTEEDFAELREFGFDDAAVVEIASMAFLESSMAKHAVGLAKFEDGENWPPENTPTPFYFKNIDS